MVYTEAFLRQSNALRDALRLRKSKIVKEVAVERGIHCKDIRMVKVTLADCIGIPRINTAT